MSWSASAWGAIACTTLFFALTCWWLTQDRSIPVYDAGYHLEAAIHFHDLIKAGDLLGPFNYNWQYPPLATLVGSFAAFVGGVNVAAPIIGENLVFSSLLALGCYQTGKLLFGVRAGLLAVCFALGSPLLIAQFHVFMLDAPETAMVAVSTWLILASRRFSRVGVSALAGLAVAGGLLVKVQYPFFVLGIVLCALSCGGWRNWRGFLTFATVVVILGSPWYVDHLSELSKIDTLAGTNSGAVSQNLPTLVSLHNLTWYLWTILNYQLLAPLFILSAGGAAWTAIALARRRGERLGERFEFFCGGVVAWLAITLTPHHDLRYGLPLLPYLAVMATGWIAHLPTIARRLAMLVLVLGVTLNTVGTTFGGGGQLKLATARAAASTYALPTSIVVFSNEGFLVAGPKRDGDLLGLLQALRRQGVTTVAWSLRESERPDFSYEGVRALIVIAGLRPYFTGHREFSGSSTIATLVHQPVTSSRPSPCARLSDGTGIFVIRGNPATRKAALYCPRRSPAFLPGPNPFTLYSDG